MRARLYSRAAFLAVICDDPLRLGDWYELTPDGARWGPPAPGELALMTPVEREIRNSGAADKREGYALPFPFTIDEFLAFERTSPFFLDEWVVQREDESACIVDQKGKAHTLPLPMVADEAALVELMQQSFEAAELVRAFVAGAEPPHVGQARPSPMMMAQEDAVISVLRRLGVDPRALPPNKRGKPGIKANVRHEVLLNRRLVRSEKVFEHAWDRLRNEGRIRLQVNMPEGYPKNGIDSG